jgi:hypothetical protein
MPQLMNQPSTSNAVQDTLLTDSATTALLSLANHKTSNLITPLASNDISQPITAPITKCIECGVTSTPLWRVSEVSYQLYNCSTCVFLVFNYTHLWSLLIAG